MHKIIIDHLLYRYYSFIIQKLYEVLQLYMYMDVKYIVETKFARYRTISSHFYFAVVMSFESSIIVFNLRKYNVKSITRHNFNSKGKVFENLSIINGRKRHCQTISFGA